MKTLTKREEKTANYVVMGLCNKTIAQKSFITERTVKQHLTNIFAKLQITSRVQLIRYMYRMQIMELIDSGKLINTTLEDLNLKD